MPVSFTLIRSTVFRPLTGDQDGDGYADAGDVLRHTLTIHNTGTTDATSVVLNDLLGGSTETGLMNISPIAFDDAFTAVGNTALRVGGAANIGSGPSSVVAGNLLTNDVGSTTIGVGALAADDVTGFTIDTVTNQLTAGGGRYSIFADGSFNYISEAGDTGTDSFSYTIRDAGINGIAGDGDDTTGTATVTITLTGQVWYVDSAAAAGGTGTSANPFNSITALNAANGGLGVDGAGDYIYVKGNAAGQLVLEQTEHLIGQGADLDVAGFHLADDGARSTVTNSAVGFGVTLAGLGTGNNEIAGINIVSTGGAGNHGLTGTSFGNLIINNTTIDASGQALVLSTGGIVAGSTGLVSTDSDGGANNVSLTGITGSLTLGSGALSGATGAAFNVSGGSVTTVYTGNVTQASAGQALVNVAGGHNGSLTFGTGTLSATNGTGLQFDNADGSYNFNGTNTLNGGDAGVDIVNGSGGNFSFSASSAITNATGIAFNVNGGAGNIDYNGTISHTANTRAISVQNHTGGIVSFDGTVSATGSSDGILLATNTGGTINFTNTLTINATGANFDASGGGTITATGAGSTINSGNVTALSVVNTNIGAADLNFLSISSSGSSAGIVLNNTGTTVGTHGGLTVTGTGVTDGSGGTIQNTTGRGASFINAIEIKLSNMTFTNAGTSDLDADNSGLSTGDNLITNAAIHLQSVTNVLLTNVDISGGAEQGINGNTVTNFALVNSSIANVGNGADEDGIHFYNMAGSSRITNTTISGSGDDNFNLQMQSGNLDLHITGGSISGGVLGSGYLFGIRGTAIANLNLEGINSSNNFSGGVVADAFDNATMNIRVNASTSSNNNDQISISSSQASNVDAEITGNTVNSTTPTLDFVGISLLGAAFSTGTFDARVHGNTITIGNGVTADGMAIFEAGAGTMNLAITNNIFTYAGTQRGILVQAGQDGAGTIRGTITGNSMDIQLDGAGNAVNGILAQSGVASPSGDGSFINMDIGGAGALANTFTHSLGGVLAGGDIRVRQRFSDNVNLSGYGGGATDTTAVGAYLDARNNEVSASTASFTSGSFSGTATPAYIVVTVSAASVAEDGATNLIYTFTRTGSTAASLVANFAITGTAAAGTDFVVSGATTFTNGTGLGTVTFSAGSATTAITVDPSADGVAEADESVVVDAGNSATANGSFARAFISNDDAALFLSADHAPGDGGSKGDGTGGELPPPPPAPTPAPGGDQPTVVDDGVLSQAELILVVDAAIDRWAAAGATPEQIAAMRAVSFSVEDLAGLALGSSSAGHITIDTNAAGFSWFVDATPGEDSEYGGSGTRLTAPAGSQAAVRIDLLTTIAHELGHQIGLGDDFNAADRDELMYGTINPGERRLPGNDDLTGASGAPLTGVAFALSPVNIGTIPAGRTVTVQWDSMVNPFNNQIVPTFNNTSSVSGGNFVTTASNTEVLGPGGTPTPTFVVLDSVTLGNLVFFDANNNGLFDGADTGINGVTLTLFADTNANGVFDSGIDVQLGTTTTAGGGLYSFANLAPGNYIVRVDAANFTGGGALLNRVTATGAADPDDNANNDDNGANGTGGIVVSQAITLTQDGETTADGTGKLDINNTLDFGFIQLNQAPVNTVPGTQTINEDATATFTGGTAISVNDVDVGAGNLTVTLSVNHGVLTLSGIAGLAFGAGDGTGDATMTFTGTQAAVNAALNGLVYAPNGNFNGSDTLTVTTNDNGNTGSDPGLTGGPADEQDMDTVTINITAINDAPTVVNGATETSTTIAEDTPLALGQSVTSLFGTHYSDAADNQVPNGGASSPGAFSGVAVTANGSSGATGQWQYSTNAGASWQNIGAVTDATARVYNPGTLIRFNPALDYNGAEPTLTVHLIDNSGPAIVDNALANLTVVGGTTPYSAGTVALGGTVTAVNDAPVNTVPGTQTINEDGTVTFSTGNGNAISVNDVDVGGGDLSVTIGMLNGQLTLSGTAGLTFSNGDGTDDTTMTFTGTQAAINAALQGLLYEATLNNNGSDTLTFTVNDQGNTGADPGLTGDGSSEEDSDSVTINITAINDTPVLTVATPLASTEQVFATIDAAASVSDIDLDALNGGSGDYGGATLTVARQGGANADDLFQFAASGSFTVNGGNLEAGGLVFASFTNAGGTLTVSFNDSGTIATTARVNAVLEAIQYANNNNTPPASIDLTVSLDDGAPANAGQGSVAGHPSTGTATVHVTITDTPENQTPVIDLDGGGAPIDNAASYTENAAPVILASGVTVSDADDTNIESAAVSVGAGFLTGFDYLTVNGATNGTITGITFSYVAATGILTLTGTATLAEYQAVLAQVGFESTSEEPGTSRAISWTVNDGTIDSAAATTTVTVTQVNDAPSGTSTAILLNEDGGSRVMAAADFGFSDVDGDNFAGVVITTLPTAGILLYDSDGPGGLPAVLAMAGQFVTAAQLSNGNLIYSAGGNNNGSPFATFTFQVRDDGGTAASGQDTDQSANTITFNVTPINDTPILTVASPLAATEQTVATIDSSATLHDTDLDGLNAGAGDYAGSTLTIERNGGAAIEDSLTFAASGAFTVNGNNLEAGGLVFGTVTGGTGSALSISFDSSGTIATTARVNAVLDAIRYTNNSNTPPASLQLDIVFNDGSPAHGQGSNAVNIGTATVPVTVNITAVDDAPMAQPDLVTTDEATTLNGSVFSSNGSGPDTDPDSPLVVSAVNGSGGNVGVQITLGSGALLKLNADGTFTYNPNHIFDATPTGGSGAINTPAHDNFSYTLAGGNTVMVSLDITGLDSNDNLIAPPAPVTLSGGIGDDTYRIADSGTLVIENNGAGNDRIITSTSYILNGSFVETLEALGNLSPINLTGNYLANTLIGNNGDNMLHGGGGVDTLIGLGGNDIYFTDVAATQVIEATGGGSDQLYTSVSYVLGTGEIELLSTNSHAATTALNLTGNNFNQTLLGNQGANMLHGGGGTDTLIGYGGNDIYFTDVAATQALEAIGGGSDQLYTSVSYVLAGGSEIELLSTNNTAASVAINLTGNQFANVLFGNAGANILDGKGGNDDLVGLAGADTFAFSSALGAGNVDQIYGYEAGIDKFSLDHNVFTGLGVGALAPGAFVVGGAAGDADDRIIYDQANGSLYFDADGNGAGAAILFAHVAGGTVLTASDFSVI